MLRRIKRIRSYAGHARYLCDVSEEPIGEIPRQRDIPSPYAFGPTHIVWQHIERGPIVIVETAHRCYDVFAVPAEMIVPLEEVQA